MTIRLLIIDRIKLLCRDLVKNQSVALSRTRSYEVKMLPSQLQTRPSSGLRAIRLVAAVAAPRLSSEADRLRWGNRGGLDIEHTRSNLG
ncbi:MAG TPA: hypothetical protein VMV91_04535 [Rhodocyclaceae bacterium]|nr:hypothetical protein [Rhodocyclaceae bacterium]HUY02966.1 hypothetical protein [Rhodocyclaceae bacterium]